MRLTALRNLTRKLMGIAAGAALATTAMMGAAQASDSYEDPYVLYYTAIQSNGSFLQNAEMFRELPDVAPSIQLASHKTDHSKSAGKKKKYSSSTSSSSNAKTRSSSSSIHSGTWTAYVDKSDQRMYVYRNGKKIHSFAVSTGKRGHRTPTGSFRANSSRIYRHYTSRKYGSKMPYSVFFHGGYAVHATYATSRLGSPASHGCVRLSPKNAATFYQIAKAQRSNLRIKIRN